MSSNEDLFRHNVKAGFIHKTGLHKLVDECIKFGRDNPETCEYKRINNDWNRTWICKNCDSDLYCPLAIPDFNFCPYCGRKIIYK